MHANQIEIRLVSEGYLHLTQVSAAIESFHKNQEKDTERLMEEKSVETRRALIRLARLYFPGLMSEKLAEGKLTAKQILDFAPASEGQFIRDTSGKFEELEKRY